MRGGSVVASVNYLKLHGRADVARIVRHCDIRERKKHEHSNIHINKEYSELNGQMKGRGWYEDSMRYYDQRIADLDATTNTNKRKDRVTAFSLEIPFPEKNEYGNEIPTNDFVNIVGRRVSGLYGKDNVVNLYIHKDEKHEYLDHGEVKMSRDHIHCIVIPEIDGKLNGKAFSSKSNMKRLNKLIDADCKERGFIFLTGAEPRKKSVEELKRASEKELRDIEELRGKYQRLREFAGNYKTKSGQSITELFDKSERSEVKKTKIQEHER